MNTTKFISFIFLIQTLYLVLCDTQFKKPTVLIAILIRNKAHTLPYFLSYLERLDYPKDRILLWVRSDNNVDNSIEIFKLWAKREGGKYHRTDIKLDEVSSGFEDEEGINHWSPHRFAHVINLRQDALDYARHVWADFILMLDADVFLTNSQILKDLVTTEHTVFAPLLNTDGMYSNFWAGMDRNYYYLRTEEYEPILFREKTGCFPVPMIHSALFINLKKTNSDRLTYKAKNLINYDGPDDDIITFAVAANMSGVPLHICNEKLYGFAMVPLENDETTAEEFQRLTNIKVEILAHEKHLPLTRDLERFVAYPTADTLGLDNIYMINLIRRRERRVNMLRLFKELGIRATLIDAVDGRTLNESSLKEWGVKLMPNYKDPYRERSMTTGEIGCFLSHYIIWKQVLEHGYKRVMVLEDDIRFEPYFRQKIGYVLKELRDLSIKWDLVYIGRKRLMEKGEPWVPGSKYLVQAAYSYWTLGYILSASGAKKLVDAKPLEKMVPVDEYLPILSDSHPRKDWKMHYPQRDLKIFSTHPLLVHPTHYTGEQGYVSDTENSTIIPEVNASQDRDDL